MIGLDSYGPKINDDDLVRLENELGQKLPNDYSKFLLLTNGGVPDLDLEVYVPGANSMPTDLQVFFGIKRVIETSDIGWNLNQFRLRFGRRDVLPIACDSGGNLFCLIYERGTPAGVVYVDCDGEGDFHQVSGSFSEFINKLTGEGSSQEGLEFQ